jgi:SNF2 family DNA or RNA helicase
LDFHVHFAAGRQAVLSHPDLARLLRGGGSAIKLADGRRAVPDPAMLADLEEVLRDCDPVQQGGGYRIRGVHRDYLNASLAQWADTAPEPGHPDEPVPGSLAKLLRPYQVDGACWLLKLARRHAGGILADEMGLGKTLQALAMIEVLPGPHLVVCPASLVWNWAREAARFVPSLQTLPIQGPSRKKSFASIASSDLVITSYPLLQRDIDHYRDINFSTLILDEAQHIKNPDSRNAKSAALLRSPARFVLTGTPLENSIRDLWSLFDFILPGYLGARADFRDRYEKPILAGERGPLWSRLVRRVRPWMLRRKKAEVLTDLPDKIEQIIEVDLTASQKEAYTSLQIAARAELDQLRERGSTGRMQVLTALLRLRQACCDLRLLGIESPEPSAKLDALLELISEAADGGHRVLVFSQFTSMLDLIANALESAAIEFCRLDGGTRDRESVVERFQSDPGITVFLISLKAGGVGLNITAADTVIHFDPWWNPAAENQATDRAHRIGQKQVVTSIKLVTRDTVENRVIELQQRKKLLLDGVLDAGAFDQVLNDDDLADLIG